MKIFVFSKDTLIVYSLVILLILGMVTFSGGIGKSVSTSTAGDKQIPIYSVQVPDKKIAITFDAAWGDEDTKELIQILGENNVKASFFMVGGWLDRFPQSAKAFKDAGHEILNHSNSHSHFNSLTPEEITKDLLTCEEKIKNITGNSKMLFRAPYGEYNDLVIKTAKDAGFTSIQWDVDSLDWKDLDAKAIADRVIKRVTKGSICLFHNGVKNTPEALKIIIPALKKQGYTFVSVSELIYKQGYYIDNNGKQIPDEKATSNID